ncbi:MAG: 16S rRNA (guanine(527)-N(7))-methyltransferase RsmG [Bacteroidales bacterium]
MTTREFNDRLRRKARKAGLSISAELAEGLEAYYRLLELWNDKINLTSLPLREAPDVAVERLLIEPLLAARFLPGDCRVLDVGSGGGSPAIPMKLALPGLQMWMVEAKTRKCAFLREAIRQLALFDTLVETARYEELLTRPDLHETMDVVTVRAVRVELRVLLGLQAFVRPGGQLFLFRGRSGPDVPATLTPPLAWQATHRLFDSFENRLVIIRKVALGAGVPRGTGA